MNLEVTPLEIQFTTNIPNQQTIPFTSSLLYHPEFEAPSNIEKYPYLISNAYFPEDALKSMEWEERISFFFNLDKMRNIMVNEMISVKEDPKEKENIENRNIFIMIKILFPTKYFVHKNIHQTLEYVTGQNPERSFFFNPFSQQFSYIKLNNRIYTNIRITWKNDLLNHPKYYELVKNTYEFLVKQTREDVRITEKYNKQTVEVNNYFEKYVARMLAILKKYDDAMTANDEQDYHTVMRIAIVNALYQWINYENSDEPFVKIFIMNIKNINDELTNKIDEKYYTPRDVDFVSKPIFDIIDDNDDTINSIKDPFLRKKEKLDLIFNKGRDLMNNDRLIKKIINKGQLYDMIVEYSLYFEQLEEELTKTKDNLMKELKNVIEFQNYKRTPFLEVLNRPEILQSNPTYRRYFVNNIEKLLDTSSTKTTLISGNHKLYALLHSNNEEDVTYFFKLMEFVYEKYILYKSVSLPEKEGFIENSSELIYTGVDNLQTRKQVYFIIDTIDGEINDQNKREYYCPFMNEYMGYLLSDFVEPNNFVKWKATPYNFVVSTSDIEEKIKMTEEKQQEEVVSPESVEPKVQLTTTTLDDNWDKFRSLINIASREKIMDILLYMKKQDQSIDETNEFAFIEKNNKSLFDALKNISKFIKKRDINTPEFKQQIQRLKEMRMIYKLRYGEKKNVLDNLPTEQMEQYDKIYKEKLENELYSTVTDNAIQYFLQKGGRKTRKKVKFSKKKDIVFIE